MRARAVLELSFESEALAQAVERAVAVDNPQGFVRQRRTGPRVRVEASGPTLRSLRETVDDYLRCAAAGEQAAAAALRRSKRL